MARPVGRKDEAGKSRCMTDGRKVVIKQKAFIKRWRSRRSEQKVVGT